MEEVLDTYQDPQHPVICVLPKEVRAPLPAQPGNYEYERGHGQSVHDHGALPGLAARVTARRTKLDSPRSSHFPQGLPEYEATRETEVRLCNGKTAWEEQRNQLRTLALHDR